MLTTQVREGLEAEIEHLRLQRQQIEDKIKAIQAVLAADAPTGQRSLLSLPCGPLGGKGLREAIRTVLTAYPSGLRTIELVAKLQEGGFTTTGKLPLKTRVYAEVARLYKEDRLSKGRGKSKRWIWAEHDQPASAAPGQVTIMS
jgi:hypothetical protein